LRSRTLPRRRRPSSSWGGTALPVAPEELWRSHLEPSTMRASLWTALDRLRDGANATRVGRSAHRGGKTRTRSDRDRGGTCRWAHRGRDASSGPRVAVVAGRGCADARRVADERAGAPLLAPPNFLQTRPSSLSENIHFLMINRYAPSPNLCGRRRRPHAPDRVEGVVFRSQRSYLVNPYLWDLRPPRRRQPSPRLLSRICEEFPERGRPGNLSPILEVASTGAV